MFPPLGKSFTGIGCVLSIAAMAGAVGAPDAAAQGVGDRVFKRPPYYTGKAVGAGATLAHLPIAYRRGGAEPELFHPAGEAGTPMGVLLREMNAYLDSLGRSLALGPASPPPPGGPDVAFGCEMSAAGDCAEADDEMRVQRGPELLLHVDRPARAWTTWAGEALERAGASHLLVLTLEIGHDWTRQVNFKGDKVVDLGTGYTVRLPWLTSLETPVGVLQLTGAVVNRDGRVVRIGAEGLLARRTALMESSIGVQALIRDEDVEALRRARREDLPGQPLVWQAALQETLARLMGADGWPPS